MYIIISGTPKQCWPEIELVFDIILIHSVPYKIDDSSAPSMNWAYTCLHQVLCRQHADMFENLPPIGRST